VETIGALEDRLLAVGRRWQPKKRTQGDGGSRKKLAAAPRRMTRSAVPAWRKGRGHTGPTVEKRRRKAPERNNGIKEDIEQDLQEDRRAGGRKARSRVFDWVTGSDWLNIMEWSALSVTEEETFKAQPLEKNNDGGGTPWPAHILSGNR
jgi:hypothetical protein